MHCLRPRRTLYGTLKARWRQRRPVRDLRGLINYKLWTLNQSDDIRESPSRSHKLLVADAGISESERPCDQLEIFRVWPQAGGHEKRGERCSKTCPGVKMRGTACSGASRENPKGALHITGNSPHETLRKKKLEEDW